MAERDDTPLDDRHALVVGGSGMLAGLCRSLAADRWHVTVVGRDPGKLARAASGDPRMHLLSADYEQSAVFVAALGEATAARGSVELAICWIRSWAPRALLDAAAVIAPGGRLFHVLGSQGSDASAAATATLWRRDDIDYRAVQLGAGAEGDGRRWLTNDEISAGVYAAVLADQPYYLVGTVAP